MIGSHNNNQKLQHSVLTALLVFVSCLLFSTSTFAQEKQDNPLDDHIRSMEDINVSHTDEHLQNKETLRDSLVLKPLAVGKPKTEVISKDKKEEEPLSFNLLYFIIQKFKVSDIVN